MQVTCPEHTDCDTDTDTDAAVLCPEHTEQTRSKQHNKQGRFYYMHILQKKKKRKKITKDTS